MNKSEMLEEVIARTGISRTDVKAVLDAVFNTNKGVIVRALKKGESVNITGFGKFERRKRKGRMGRNPQNGEPVRIKASKTASFRAGKSLRAAM
jgi:DNA-binding protein HU-beta